MILAELVARGFSVRIDIAGRLQVGPSKRLTPAIRAAIKASRDSLYRECLERNWVEFEALRARKPKGNTHGRC